LGWLLKLLEKDTVARHKSVFISCPQYNRFVRGRCECNETGDYKLAADGSFTLEMIQCSQMDSRCMQTLCALHRYNRRAPGTWYPDKIVASRDVPTPAQKPARQPKPGNPAIPFDGTFSIDV